MNPMLLPCPSARQRIAASCATSGLLALLSLAGCGSDAAPQSSGSERVTPVVITGPRTARFADRIEALGTARANESVVITARVMETIQRVNFEDGQNVERDAILLELTSTEESAQLDEARANYQDARLRYQRIADLARQGTESRSRLDEVSAARDAARARLAELRARLSDRLVRAPFRGVLGLREVSPGGLVRPGERITTLDDIDLIKVDFSVPERFLASLQPGQLIRTHAAAYPDRRFEGSITAIDTRIDPRSRAVRARAEIPNPDHALRPGMLLSLEVRANPRTSTALPEEAVVPLGNKHFIVLVDEQERARRMEVELGRREPGWVEILDALPEDTRIIIDGSTRVRPGGRVRILQAPEAAKPESATQAAPGA